MVTIDSNPNEVGKIVVDKNWTNFENFNDIAEKLIKNLEFDKTKLLNVLKEYPHKKNGFISVKNDNGEIINVIIYPYKDNYILYIYQDPNITDLKNKLTLNSEENLRQMKLSSLGEMAAGIAHDINNPLGIIVSSVELGKFEIEEFKEEFGIKEKEEFKDLSMANKWVKNAKKSFLELLSSLDEIETGANRAADIVEGMRMFSRKDQNDFKKQNLNKVIETSISFAKTFLRKNEMEITYSNNNKDLILNCKEILLSQMIVNMLKNSCDALEEESKVKKWIDISIEDGDNEVTIKVSDGGDGIPKSVQDRMFEPFYTTKEIGKGTGLGLSMAYKIVEGHNGKMYIDNDSKNTCIIFTLNKNI